MNQSRMSEILTRIREQRAQKLILANPSIPRDTFTSSIPSIPSTPQQESEAEINEEQETEIEEITDGDEELAHNGHNGYDLTEATDRYGNRITYNERQQQFINLVSSGRSCVLIGAAGTGKTTCMQGAVNALIQLGIAKVLNAEDHKHLKDDTPGILVCAFTRRATNNIAANMSPDMRDNCMTIHKALEYEPIYYEVFVKETGKYKNTMRFEATRHRHRPLPNSINVVIIEEASMPSVALFNELKNAFAHHVQFIFLGDIQQLPPVFGTAILGYKLLELPVVELTEVYRQALDSPIIKLAHRILSGKVIPPSELPEWNLPGLVINPWVKKINQDRALGTLAQMFNTLLDNGKYIPGEDMILLPQKVGCGTIELNKHIANHIAKKAKRKVFEILAGFQKVYLSIGETVMFEKEDATILDIYPNPKYIGKAPQPASETLDYWGHEHGNTRDYGEHADVDMEALMNAFASDSEEKLHQSSHVIKLLMANSEQEILIDRTGEVTNLMLGYALTVHKAQGSEWKKVFFCTHSSHAKMMQRELLYTAVTRAREKLIVICEPDLFVKGILSQRIKGDTLAEKAEYFKGKLDTLSEDEVA